MGKNVYDGIMQAANMAVYQDRIYDTDNIKFRLGIVDRISNANYMAVAVSEVNYSDGSRMPAVIVSKEDMKELFEKYDKSEVLPMIRFFLGHEVGHLIDFKVFPERKWEDIDDLKEIEADIYSVNHNNLSLSEYKKSMDILCAGMESVYERTYCGINRFLHKKLYKVFLNDRLNKVIAEMGAYHKKEVDTIYEEMAEFLYEECQKTKVIQFNQKKNSGGKRNG